MRSARSVGVGLLLLSLGSACPQRGIVLPDAGVDRAVADRSAADVPRPVLEARPDQPPREALVCPAGRAYCDKIAKNGCEVELATDAVHCGACGRFCQGGACAQGKCQPMTLASNLVNPEGIAVDSSHVYWAVAGGTVTGGEIAKAPKLGGTPVSLAQFESPKDVAVNATHVYWTNASTWIKRVPLGGGQPSLFVGGQSSTWQLALDGTNAYWTDLAQGKVLMAPLAGGAPTVLATQPGAWGVTVDAGEVYFTTYETGNNAVIKVSPGKAPVVLTSEPGSPRYRSIAAMGGEVFWTDDGNGSPGGVRRVSVAGGTAVALASGYPGSSPLAVDQTHVYWGCQLGSIPHLMRVSLSGSAPEILGQRPGTLRHLALDDSSVYWTETGAPGAGAVLKLAK